MMAVGGAGSVVLGVSGLVKRYPGVIALNDVTLSFRSGEIHALVGENGAGKSTLIKALSGYLRPDSGTIEVAGRDFGSLTSHEALRLGIGTIYQDANLVGDLSVAENVLLGDLPRGRLFVRRREMVERTNEVLVKLGIDIDPLATVNSLSASQAQFVAIARAMARDVRVLIMDEPTAALTDAECGHLFDLVGRLREQGVCVIYITHRMREVLSLADRITVMRDGRVVTTVSAGELGEDELVQLIAGRPVEKVFPTRTMAGDGVVLSVEGLSGHGVHGVSFDLRRGEILGVAGLMGSGRSEMARMLFGADVKTGGRVALDGAPTHITTPRDAVALGIGYVPADRKRHGVILDQSVGSNITLSSLRRLSRLVVDSRRERAVVDGYVDGLKIKASSTAQPVSGLSGGNQQKVALGKWLASEARVLVFDEPTQGVDVGARHEIYRLMNSLTDQGISIIVLSSDLDELMGMSDRILVMHEGEVAGMLDERSQYSQEAILRLASGLESQREAA